MPYRYRGTLSIYYRLRQAYSPTAHQSTASDVAEPELWLAFDMRIRTWIDSMMTRP